MNTVCAGKNIYLVNLGTTVKKEIVLTKWEDGIEMKIPEVQGRGIMHVHYVWPAAPDTQPHWWKRPGEYKDISYAEAVTYLKDWLARGRKGHQT